MPKPKAAPIISPAVRDDPIEFARRFLINRDGTPFEPHDAQQQMLRGVQPLTVAVCGRQLGKSVGMGAYSSWFSTTHSNRETYIIAPTLDQARIIFNEVAFQFRNTELAALVQGKIVDYPFPRINLANGSIIHARGANSPQYIRGKRAHLIICDEAAFMKDKVITDAIEPMLTVTGKEKDSALILISTPFGLGAFQDMYHACVKGEGAHFHFSSLDNPHADMKRLEKIKARYGEDSLLWKTEYLAEFVDDDLAVFPWANIKWAYENYPYQDQSLPIKPVEGNRYVQGVDLANVRDWFVSTILDTTNPSLNTLVRYDRFQKRGYTAYKDIIRANHNTYNHADTLIDATSLGESVVEDVQDIGAEGYKFSNQSKYEVVQELARMLSEHRLAIPLDRTVIDELRYFTYEITPSKNLKMEAKQGHDDIVMSLALAAHLACLPHNIGFFQGVSFNRPVPKPSKPDLSNYYDPWAALFKDDE